MKKITSIKDIEVGDELIVNETHGKFFKYKVTKVYSESIGVSCIKVANNERVADFDSCKISCFSHILNKDEKKPSVGTLRNMLKRRDAEIARLKKELEEYKDAIFQIRNILPD